MPVLSRGKRRFSRADNNGNFYRTTRWRKLQRAKRMANPLCERCEGNGLVTPMEEVHHIIPIDDDMSKCYEWDNLMSVCYLCHKQITNEYHKALKYTKAHPTAKYGGDLQSSLNDFDIPL